MADAIKCSVDLGSVFAGLDRLTGEAQESLGRRMAVAGARVVRDEARVRAGTSEGPYNSTSRGSAQAGTLQNAIYVAYNTTLSTPSKPVYTVTWSNTKAWWGKLKEFGYFRRYAIFKDKEGVWHTIKDRPLAEPVWVGPTPFLRPAFDARSGDAIRVMLDVGQMEFPKLMQAAP